MAELLQERVGAGDPWKIIACSILLNLTNYQKVESISRRLFEVYPTAADMAEADSQILFELIRPLGLGRRRVRYLKEFSEQYLEQRETLGDENLKVKEMSGCGKYAEDAYRLLYLRDSSVEPTDYALLERLEDFKDI